MNRPRYLHDLSQLPENAVPIAVERFDRAGLLNALARTCQFPDYFGHNWDAAWDCLQDCTLEHLYLHIPKDTRVPKETLRAFLSLFEDLEDIPQTPMLWIFDERPKPPRREKAPKE